MTVQEFRVVLTTADFDRAVAFYRDGLGLDPGDLWTEGGNGQVLWAGKAAIEIFDLDYARSVDEIEVGERVSGQIRFVFQVVDVHAAVKRALQYGAKLVHEPCITPWNDLNARLVSPEGLQITLYEPQKKN